MMALNQTLSLMFLMLFLFVIDVIFSFVKEKQEYDQQEQLLFILYSIYTVIVKVHCQLFIFLTPVLGQSLLCYSLLLFSILTRYVIRIFILSDVFDGTQGAKAHQSQGFVSPEILWAVSRISCVCVFKTCVLFVLTGLSGFVHVGG